MANESTFLTSECSSVLDMEGYSSYSWKNINSKPMQTNKIPPQTPLHYTASSMSVHLYRQGSSDSSHAPASFCWSILTRAGQDKAWCLQPSQSRWSLIFPASHPIFPVSRAYSDSPSLRPCWPFLCHASHCVIIYICSLVLWSSRGHTAGSLLL